MIDRTRRFDIELTISAATATGGALVGLGLSILFLWLGKRWHAKRKAAREGEWGEDSKAEQGHPKGSRQDLEGKPESQSEGRI
jgi:hypothetical protein